MRTPKLSRRRVLSSLLAVLTAWLFPRPPQAAAAARRSAPPLTLSSSQSFHTCSYAYDGTRRLFCLTDHPLRSIEPTCCSHVAHLNRSTSIYDFG